MPVDFNQIFQKLLKETEHLAKKSVSDFAKEATKDGASFLNKTKTRLEKWTLQLEKGELTVDEVKFLVLGQKDLVEMEALKQAGLAKIKADAFRNDLLNLITSTILTAIKR